MCRAVAVAQGGGCAAAVSRGCCCPAAPLRSHKASAAFPAGLSWLLCPIPAHLVLPQDRGSGPRIEVRPLCFCYFAFSFSTPSPRLMSKRRLGLTLHQRGVTFSTCFVIFSPLSLFFRLKLVLYKINSTLLDVIHIDYRRQQRWE